MITDSEQQILRSEEEKIDKYLVYNAYKKNSYCTIPMPNLNEESVSILMDKYIRIGWSIIICRNHYYDIEWEFSISED